jgi:DNA-binding CsgD family transcriptional regulator
VGSLLERRTELDAIATSLTSARSGTARALLFEGPAGIGKTALLEAAVELARRRSMRPLAARGAELERAFPFGVVRQLFEREVLGRTGAGEREVLSGAAGLAAPVFGLARPPALRAPADDREAALFGLYWLMSALADSAPVLLSLDDLQWADAASVEWLAYTLARLDGLPVTVVGAFRSDDSVASEQTALLAAVERNTDVVRLAPLGEEATGALLTSALGRTIVAAAARTACFRMTKGNPLLVREVARAVADAAGPEAIDAEDVERVSSPRISRLVQARLRRLSPEAGELARAVAILGSDAQLVHAATLAELPIEAAANLGDQLRGAGLLEPGDTLGFVHPLVGRGIYLAVPAGRRAMLHARVARLLDKAHADAEHIAAHLLRSEPAGEAWVVDRLWAAARDAAARGAPVSAVELLERALREGGDHRRMELLHALGAAETVLLRPAAEAHLREAYRLARGTEAGGHVAVTLGRAILTTGAAVTAGAPVLREAIAELGAQRPDMAMRLESMLACGLRMDPEWAGRIAERLGHRRMSPPSGAAPGERAILAAVAGDAACLGVAADTVAGWALAALAAGRLLSEQTCESPVFLMACTALTWAGRYDAARTVLGEALDDAAARGSELGYVYGTAFRAQAAYAAGSIRDAEADARAALSVMGAQAAVVAAPLAAAWLALACLERGAIATAGRAFDEHALAGRLPATGQFAPVLYARGAHALAVRETRPAREDFLATGRNLLAAACPTPCLVPWRSAAARAAAILGEADAAVAEADEELRLARAAGAPGPLGAALRAVAAVGDADVRVDRLREAVAVLEASEARLEHAHALCDLGAALRHAGALRESREPLRLALDAAERCGAPPLADRARGELLASGARPRRTRMSGRDALTPAELRVAELAVTGATNREIAQALFVTVKTVETQLGSAFRKLGVHSRRELGAALAAQTVLAS